MTTPRNTTTRDRDRAAIRRSQAPCGICGTAIDYSLPYLHPGSFVVDHVVPLARGGGDELANKQAAHRSCNRTKGDRMPGEEPKARRRRRTAPFVTDRDWS